MSKDLKKRGFSFVGSTICYAFMQAMGLVNDHVTGCFRYGQVGRISAGIVRVRGVPSHPFAKSAKKGGAPALP